MFRTPVSKNRSRCRCRRRLYVTFPVPALCQISDDAQAPVHVADESRRMGGRDGWGDDSGFRNTGGAKVNDEQGYSGTFYVMLIIGIVGVVGFFVVAAGAAGGM